ncbi:ATP synthase F(1) complex subunit delta, mitochondrial-like [Clavelina lepadiformis]|uniref:ATP synthase F(1) complex subunit delta, mitochondrial n=1 Tax=Clavelina lepadiformis TaxID=159417 RepID=A0ABP0F9X2_CLALP
MASALMRVCTGNGAVCRSVLNTLQKRSFAEAAVKPSQMCFTFASPSEVFYEGSENVKQVDVPTGTGTIGILANHVPTLGVLKPGVLTVLEAEGTVNKYFVSSGSFSVNEDASVQITAEEAVPVDYLDRDLARSNLAKAQAELASATTDEAKMEAQISISCNEAMINA